jgi:hypothetical protein
MSIEQMFMM